ncbi:sigma-54-dependent transcriptional regulator [Desulfonatronum lacustre]|uniref:sigma-54-dependent transcriptional regulator n=1 Tax=Desulfonatronum lacustre TaxID=66849 RepID=UPI000490AC8A|nr:sigma-54 dependent transcriptional regulator [Desulfonatronum lacustre]SMP50053.1 DNA-binding transcriptional response regulator, NtrC family, contains REC, AAA-type ATPase, and a Fis-type DNA-binding domains [Desulfonatronum zhilinae]
MHQFSVLIVDDERDMLDGLRRILPYELDNTNITVTPSPLKALEMVSETSFDLVLMDVRMPEMNGMELLEHVKAADPKVTVIMMTAYGNIEIAVQSIKMGAYDFITKPFDIPDLVRLIRKALERSGLIRENQSLRQKISEKTMLEEFVGQSPPMRQLYETIRSVAGTDYPVLIRGESGTGKELAAKAIHALSRRGEKVLVSVNCPAIPEHLLESELFGHKKGAFTGALKDHKGLFVEANGSSLHLDEIADIPVSVQTKLLRALQEQEIRPLGSSGNKKVDVRIVSTTNQDLEHKIQDKSFREDLFYRLNVVSVRTPPLREIVDDIPLLVHHFNRLSAVELNTAPKIVSSDLLEVLMHREWPGNVRELKNFVRRLIIFCPGEELNLSVLKMVDGRHSTRPTTENAAGTGEVESYAEAKARAVNAFTAEYVGDLLSKAGGNVSQAAKMADMSRVALQKIIRKMNISPVEYRAES